MPTEPTLAELTKQVQERIHALNVGLSNARRSDIVAYFSRLDEQHRILRYLQNAISIEKELD